MIKEAHIDPPADADATKKVRDKYAKEPVPEPGMCDTTVAEIVCSKGKLVPEHAEEDRAGDKIGMGVGYGGHGAEENIAEDFRTVSGEVWCFVQAGLFYFVVEGAVGDGMLLLCGRREARRWRANGGEGGDVTGRLLRLYEQYLRRRRILRRSHWASLSMPGLSAVWTELADPARHDRRQERLPRQLDAGYCIAVHSP